MAVWRMRITCWIRNATDAHSEYLIRIDIPPQKWLRERSSTLRLYVYYLSLLMFNFVV